MNKIDNEFNRACETYGNGEYSDALAIFKKLANDGHIGAILRAADCFLRGIGSEKDTDKAKEYFAIAQKSGVREAGELLQLIEKDQELEVEREYWKNYQG